MMMEAIRLSLAAEEERKKKEEKDAAKEAKKEEKKKVKEQKKADKAARKSGFFPASSSSLNLDMEGESSSAAAGKGKEVDRSGGAVGFNPLAEPTSTINTSSSKEDSQRHLEHSRAQIQREASSTGSQAPFDPFSHRSALRNLSHDSSSASSFAESLPGSLQQGSLGGFGASASSFEPSPNVSGVSLNRDETPPQGTPGAEPMFNFRSLEAIISDKKDDDKAQHLEHVPDANQSTHNNLAVPEEPNAQEESSKRSTPDINVQPPDYVETPEAPKQAEAEAEVPDKLQESVATLKPKEDSHDDDDDEIATAPPVEVVSNHHPNGLDSKHIGEINIGDSRQQHAQ
jgi:hypothetical protein